MEVRYQTRTNQFKNLSTKFLTAVFSGLSFVFVSKYYLIVATLGFYPWQEVFALEMAKVLSHSELEIVTYQGDSLQLQVDAEGEKLKYRWVRDEKAECNLPKCTVNTQEWSLGTHELVVVVFNKAGSQTITFKIKILARTPEVSPRELVPQVVPADASLESITANDLVVVAVKGIGYSFHNKKVQLIGKFKRKLEWAEKLKAHPTGTVKFGKKDVEEHFITSSSMLGLIKSKDDRRIIKLNKGTMRSRQIKEEDPQWSIQIGDHIQIDTDKKGDVIVENPELSEKELKKRLPYSKIHVLRGYARVYYKIFNPKKEGAEKDARVEQLIIPAGVSVQFDYGMPASPFVIQDAKVVSSVIKMTSPQYIELKERKKPEKPQEKVDEAKVVGDKKSPTEPAQPNSPPTDTNSSTAPNTTVPPADQSSTDTATSTDTNSTTTTANPQSPETKAAEPVEQDPDEADESWLLDQTTLPQELDDALKKAKKFADANDYFAVIEVLAPFLLTKKYKDDYNLNFFAAKAYKFFKQQKLAIKYFKRAIKADEDQPYPYFEIAMMAMEAKKWQKALQALEDAESRDFEDQQLLYYYLAVANFALENNITAKSQFQESLWEVTNQDVETSARKFLMHLRDNKLFGIYGNLGAGYISNIFRLSDSADLPEGFTINKAVSIYYGGGFTITAYDQVDGSLVFGYDILRTGYMEDELDNGNVQMIDQSIYADMFFNFGGDEFNPMFRFMLKPYLTILFLGEERAIDSFRFDTSFGMPSVWGKPTLTFKSARNVDPLPARNDVLDPITKEVVSASDRSSGAAFFGLILTYLELKRLTLDVDLESGYLEHEKEIVKEDNWTQNKIDFGLRFQPTLSNVVNTKLRYLLRDYAESDDGRKDTQTLVRSTWRYYFTPIFWNDLFVEYIINSSSRDTNAYNRYEVGFQTTLDL